MMLFGSNLTMISLDKFGVWQGDSQSHHDEMQRGNNMKEPTPRELELSARR